MIRHRQRKYCNLKKTNTFIKIIPPILITMLRAAMALAGEGRYGKQLHLSGGESGRCVVVGEGDMEPHSSWQRKLSIGNYVMSLLYGLTFIHY